MVSVIIGQFIVWNHVECDRCLFSDASQQPAAVDLQQDSRHHCAGPAGSSVGTGAAAFQNHAATAIGRKLKQNLMTGAIVSRERRLHLANPGAAHFVGHDPASPLAILRFKEMKKTLLQRVHTDGVRGERMDKSDE